MNRPWMPLYVGDYLADTRHLSTEEHGIYFLLILHYWRTGGLPVDDTRLARIAGVPQDTWNQCRSTISAFFDASWKHKRIELELETTRRQSAAGKTGGIASGKARKQKQTSVQRSLPNRLNDPPTIVQASQSQSDSSEANASDASASGREALWGNGVTALIALGVSETRAKPMIGRWLKDAGDDFERVLGAISRARSEAPIDPIAWITAALKAEGGKNGKPENLSAVARRLAEQGIGFGPKPSLAGAGGEADSPPVRLLSKG